MSGTSNVKAGGEFSPLLDGLWRFQTIKGPIIIRAKTALEAANNLWRENDCTARSIALCPNDKLTDPAQ